jgi:hypothetical protein
MLGYRISKSDPIRLRNIFINPIRNLYFGSKIRIGFVHLYNRPFPFERNFDLDKSGKKFHHSLKEHITKLVIFRSFVVKCCKNADNIALQRFTNTFSFTKL